MTTERGKRMEQAVREIHRIARDANDHGVYGGVLVDAMEGIERITTEVLALTAPQGAGQGGMVEWPEEPSEEMIQAADNSVNEIAYEVYRSEIITIYKAMRAAHLSTAAPQAGKVDE